MIGVHRVPRGELEGRLALGVQCTTLDWDDPLCLVRDVCARRLSGVSVVQLVQAPWGTGELDVALGALGADPRTAHMVVWEERAPTGDWCATPIHLVLDLSVLTARPMSVPTLVTRVQQLPLVPQPTELLVRDPSPQIGPGHLDELTTRLDCPVGWVYLGDQADQRTVDAVELAVAKTAGTWGVRRG